MSESAKESETRSQGSKPKEYVSLPPGRYGDKKTAGLEILMLNGSRPTDKDPHLIRNSFLVAALPNGEGHPVKGTAFLSFNIDPRWLADDVLAMVFNSEAPEDQKKRGEQVLYDIAVQKCVAANVSADKLEQAAQEQFESLKTQIQISVGTIYRLQDWDGEPRSAHANFRDWEGLEFSGDVTEREYQGKKTSEVRVLKHRVKHEKDE